MSESTPSAKVRTRSLSSTSRIALPSTPIASSRLSAGGASALLERGRKMRTIVPSPARHSTPGHPPGPRPALGAPAGLGGEAVNLAEPEPGPLADRLGGEERLKGAAQHLG